MLVTTWWSRRQVEQPALAPDQFDGKEIDQDRRHAFILHGLVNPDLVEGPARERRSRDLAFL